jgi:hypothetical protein
VTEEGDASTGASTLQANYTELYLPTERTCA